MYVCMYVCVYVCVCMYVYVCMHIQVNINTVQIINSWEIRGRSLVAISGDPGRLASSLPPLILKVSPPPNDDLSLLNNCVLWSDRKASLLLLWMLIFKKFLFVKLKSNKSLLVKHDSNGSPFNLS